MDHRTLPGAASPFGGGAGRLSCRRSNGPPHGLGWLLLVDLSGGVDDLDRVDNRSGWMVLHECFDELAQSWL
jgi:hypothetical protein